MDIISGLTSAYSHLTPPKKNLNCVQVSTHAMCTQVLKGGSAILLAVS